MTVHRTLGSVWPRPGKEPLVNIDRAVFIAVHDESTILTTIRPFPEWHELHAPTPATGLGRVVLI